MMTDEVNSTLWKTEYNVNPYVLTETILEKK